jgi:hypothetical protein
MTIQRTWSPERIRALGVTTDLATAGSILGIGRTNAYRLAQDDDFPVPVMRIGTRYIVPVAHLLKALGIEESAPITRSPDDGIPRIRQA